MASTPSATDNRPSGVRKNRVALTGNHVDIFIGSQKIGYLNNFQIQSSNGLQELAGIGSGKVQENAPSLQRISCTASRAVLMKASLEKLLSSQAPDSANNPFINMNGALEGLVFDIAVIQRPSGTSGSTGATNDPIRWVKGASIDGQQMQIGANTFFYDNVSMKALDVAGDFSGTGFDALSDMDATTAGV